MSERATIAGPVIVVAQATPVLARVQHTEAAPQASARGRSSSDAVTSSGAGVNHHAADLPSLPFRAPPPDIVLVCQAWQLGRTEKGTATGVPEFTDSTLTLFYRAGRFGDASGTGAATLLLASQELTEADRGHS